MSMNKVLSIDISIQMKALSSRLANFIFPEPVTPFLEGKMMQDLFESFCVACRTGADSTFPTLDLISLYGVEGDLQISFFSRALADFQRNINQVFINHGVMDEVAFGGYTKATVNKGRLVLSNGVAGGNVLLTELRNDYKYSNHHARSADLAESTEVPAIVFA